MDTNSNQSATPSEAGTVKAPELGVVSGWPSMAPDQRNYHVGEALGFKPETQCWIGVDGRRLLSTVWNESKRSEAEAMTRLMQTYDSLWKDSLADSPSLRPEMRGKLEVIVERWHMRYSDTPAGGWEVVEWLKPHGNVEIKNVAFGWWRVALDMCGSHRGVIAEQKPTMAEAACLVALRFVRSANTRSSATPEENV